MTDDAKKTSSKKSSLIKFLILLIMGIFVVALVWVTLLNWKKDDKFSFRIFDPAWWHPGMASARPMVESARQVSERATDAMWGNGGLVEQAEQWWNAKNRPTSDQPASTASTAPAAPPAAPNAKKYERAIADAEVDFQIGLDHYRRANPNGAIQPADSRDHLREARAHFLSAKDLLDRSIDPYAAIAEHNAERLEDAKALAQYNGRLLASLNRLMDTP